MHVHAHVQHHVHIIAPGQDDFKGPTHPGQRVQVTSTPCRTYVALAVAFMSLCSRATRASPLLSTAYHTLMKGLVVILVVLNSRAPVNGAARSRKYVVVWASGKGGTHPSRTRHNSKCQQDSWYHLFLTPPPLKKSCAAPPTPSVDPTTPPHPHLLPPQRENAQAKTQQTGPYPWR